MNELNNVEELFSMGCDGLCCFVGAVTALQQAAEAGLGKLCVDESEIYDCWCDCELDLKELFDMLKTVDEKRKGLQSLNAQCHALLRKVGEIVEIFSDVEEDSKDCF